MGNSTPIAGIHSVRTALKYGDGAVSEVWLERKRRDRRLAEVVELARKAAVPIRQVERGDLDRAAQGAKHQGVLAWGRIPAARDEKDLQRILERADGPPFFLVLDVVQDPRNLGACLRTADGAGVHAVIAPRDSAVGLTPVACKVASGAAQTVPYVQVTNLARSIEALKEQGIWFVGAEGESVISLFETDLAGPLALVMGGEGKGMRRLTRERCDLLARLPMLGTIESLNVSVAAGICLYEALRQRSGPGGRMLKTCTPVPSRIQRIFKS